MNDPKKPGSLAFADSELAAVVDLYYQFATETTKGTSYLDLEGVRELLASIGERPDESTLGELFRTADLNCKGTIDLNVSCSCRRTLHPKCACSYQSASFIF